MSERYTCPFCEHEHAIDPGSEGTAYAWVEVKTIWGCPGCGEQHRTGGDYTGGRVTCLICNWSGFANTNMESVKCGARDE